jgi:hypothetical protein
MNQPWRRSASCLNSQRSAKATRLSRFSARANIRAAVWDKPRSDYAVGVCRFMGRTGVVEVHRYSRKP